MTFKKTMRRTSVLFIRLFSLAALCCFYFACTPQPAAVSPEVAAIIKEKCVDCHSVKFITLPEIAYKQYLGGCGGCHIPLPDGHSGDRCVECHSSPAVTHFSLRDENDQTRLRADAEKACIACHTGNFNKSGKGFPPLTKDEEIITYARQGTLRSWIQPGGAMAKYLTAKEAKTLTSWIDSISRNRVLDYDPYLDAVKTGSDFDISGKGDNPAWASAPEHIIALGPTPLAPLAGPATAAQVSQVTLKALYSNDYLYIRAEYRDPTLSMTRAGAWIHDASAGAWNHPPAVKIYEQMFPAAEVYTRQAEDGLGFIWNISIPGFRDKYGCAFKCHGSDPGASCFTDAKGAAADIWRSRAASGMAALSVTQAEPPVITSIDGSYTMTGGEAGLNGYADDNYLTWYMNLAAGYNTASAGRTSDEGSGAFSSNVSTDKQAPRYLEKYPDNYMDALVLSRQEIDAGEAIIADQGDSQYAGADAVAAAWAWYEALNAVVPEMVLEAPSGSRKDVRAAATWKDGIWTVEFKRTLITGSSDDAQFFPFREYEFSVTVFDNCGWGEVPTMHNTYGSGQYQILRFKK
jgi:hypothetical protein